MQIKLTPRNEVALKELVKATRRSPTVETNLALETHIELSQPPTTRTTAKQQPRKRK